MPPVVLTVVTSMDATRAGLAAEIQGQAFDIIHFAGHGRYAEGAAQDSAIDLADGPLSASDVAGLGWSSPPYVVFNSSCESGRVALGRGLINDGHVNALPAAFLAAGTVAYLGHFWPVSDKTAAVFASTFYGELFRLVNVGRAIVAARHALRPAFDERADLTAFGAVFFGDAGSADRPDSAVSTGGGTDDGGKDDGGGDHGPGRRADIASAA
jgi:CHAT domain-containing protein